MCSCGWSCSTKKPVNTTAGNQSKVKNDDLVVFRQLKSPRCLNYSSPMVIWNACAKPLKPQRAADPGNCEIIAAKVKNDNI